MRSNLKTVRIYFLWVSKLNTICLRGFCRLLPADADKIADVAAHLISIRLAGASVEFSVTDVLQYKESIDLKRKAALKKLARQAQKLDFGY